MKLTLVVVAASVIAVVCVIEVVKYLDWVDEIRGD